MEIILPNTSQFISAALGFSFFFLILGLSVISFSRKLTSPAAAAALPLAAIPCTSDWLFFLLPLPYPVAFGFACLIFTILALANWISQKNFIINFNFTLWGQASVLIFFAYFFVRLWWLTGSVPNPADDIYAGYKSLSILWADRWPLMPHAEAPDVSIAYYYYAYSWPAALAYWLNIDLYTGWWLTSIVLCSVGATVLMEIIRPWFKCFNSLLSLLPLVGLVVCGASFLVPILLALGVPLKSTAHIPKSFFPESLDLGIPSQTQSYWMPFCIFSTGIVIWALRKLLLAKNNWSFPVALTLCFFLACLPGYCTFLPLGIALSVIPAVTLAFITSHRWNLFWQLAKRSIFVGFSSLLGALPFLLLLSKRSLEQRPKPYGDFLPVWLIDHSNAKTPEILIGLLFLIILGLLLCIPLGWSAFFVSKRPFTFLERCVAFSFLGSCLVSILGITLDFVAKFSMFTTFLGTILFLLRTQPNTKALAYISIALVGPALYFANGIRANLFHNKHDPLWKSIDQLPKNSLVVFDVDARDSLPPWDDVMPFFARSRFISPPTQIDETGRNFMSNPTLLKDSPPLYDRIKSLKVTHIYRIESLGTPNPNIIAKGKYFQLTGPYSSPKDLCFE